MEKKADKKAGKKEEIKKPSKYQAAIDSHSKVGITTYTIDLENGMSCIVKKPSIMTTAKVMPLMVDLEEKQNQDFGKASIILVDECWIAGDDEIRTDDELKVEAGLSMMNIVQLKIGALKKN